MIICQKINGEKFWNLDALLALAEEIAVIAASHELPNDEGLADA